MGSSATRPLPADELLGKRGEKWRDGEERGCNLDGFAKMRGEDFWYFGLGMSSKLHVKMREGKWTYSWPNLDQKFRTLLGSSEWALSAPNGKDLYSGLFR